MSSRTRRWLLGGLSALVVLILVLGALGWTATRRSMPVIQGELTLPGLHGSVDVFRDAYGVPNIYASDEHDLFMAQGYIHAQDRFWQMDFWRHVGAGRLAEMFGASEVDTDKFLRTMGWERVSQQELDQIDPDTLTILQAYADGVNAYLADHKGTSLSLEYGILKLLSPSYQPAPWSPINTLTWAKAMAWDLGGNMDGEIERALLLKTLSADQVDQLYPPYPSDHPTIVKDYGSAGVQTPAVQTASVRQAAPALDKLSGQVRHLNALLGGGLPGIGSNNWVIGGQRTQTGQPLLANDPHLGIQLPSIWYQIGLHCRTVDASCRYDAGGFSFAGAPGVIIGHNDHIAWGLTNVGPDVQDLFIEKINPDNPDQYELNGKWQDMTLVHETIQVSGGQDVDLTVRYTRHGPIVSTTYGKLENFTDNAGITLPEPYALALQWTALQPTRVFAAVLEYDRATDWDSFRQALRDFAVPSQNFVFADTQGNIGYQMPGQVPIRADGDGWLPAPGWTTDYDWTGMIPFDQLPSAFNPADGYIATANNPVAGSDYPNFISRDWDYGYRAARIVQMIEAKPKLSAQDIQSIQGDNLDAGAAITLPYLLKLQFDDPLMTQALDSLKTWNQQDSLDSEPAATYNLFWHQLILSTFSDELPDGPLPDGSRAFAVFSQLMDSPDSTWWDDHTTDAVETRDDILRSAFTQAIDQGRSAMGTDLSRWEWGSLHTATFRNQSLGESGVGPIEALFNRGPFAVNGGTSIVNATAWKVDKGFEVTSLPSMRIINDLSNWDNTLWIQTSGQSGHAFNAHYIDQADLWRQIQYFPMAWSEAAVRAAAVDHLTLKP
jgi:penicillin amidase